MLVVLVLAICLKPLASEHVCEIDLRNPELPSSCVSIETQHIHATLRSPRAPTEHMGLGHQPLSTGLGYRAAENQIPRLFGFALYWNLVFSCVLV